MASSVDIIRAKAREDRLFYNSEVLFYTYNPNLIQTSPGSIHHEMVEFYDDTEIQKECNPYPRTLLMAPRGSLKTSLMVVGDILWELFKDPNQRILVVSARKNLAQQILGEIRTIVETNSRVRKWFPELLPGGKWGKEEIVIAGRNQSLKEPSVRGVGLGTTITGEHYDRIYLDDVVTEDNVRTKLSRNRTWEYLRALTPILHMSGRRAQIRITGTVWHADDIYGRIFKKDKKAVEKGRQPDYAVKVIRALVRDAQDKQWVSTFEAGLPTKFLLQLKASDPTFFAMQYQNKVVSKEEQLFSSEDIERWSVDRTEIDLAEFNRYPAYCMVDPAISLSEEADQSAIVSWRVDHEGRVWVFHIWAGRVRPEALLSRVYSFHENFGYERIWFEANGFQVIYQDVLRRHAAERGWIPVQPVKRRPGEKKEGRIEALQLFAKQDYLRFLVPLPGWDQFLEEAFTWPRPVHDDILDAMAEVVRHKPSKAKVIQMPKRDFSPFETIDPAFGEWGV